jgi:hypothetical protein
MQHNYQDTKTNNHSGGRGVWSSTSYSVVRPDGTVISWTSPSSPSDKATPKT